MAPSDSINLNTASPQAAEQITATDPTSSTLPLTAERFVQTALVPPQSMTGIMPQALYPLTDYSRLFFSAYTPAAGRELWTSDGTPEGTALVKDLTPGAVGSNPDSMHDIDGELWFWAYGGPGEFRELWRSDGTVTGTVRLDAAYAKVSQVIEGPLAKANNRLFFTGRSGAGVELWFSQGTAASTQQVLDLNPGPGDSNPQSFVVANNRLYFTAFDGQDWGVWRTDGSVAGTERIISAVQMVRATPMAGQLFIEGRAADHTCALWAIQLANSAISQPVAGCPVQMIPVADWGVLVVDIGDGVLRHYRVQPNSVTPIPDAGNRIWLAAAPGAGHLVYVQDATMRFDLNTLSWDTARIYPEMITAVTLTPNGVYAIYKVLHIDPDNSYWTLGLIHDDGTTIRTTPATRTSLTYWPINTHIVYAESNTLTIQATFDSSLVTIDQSAYAYQHQDPRWFTPEVLVSNQSRAIMLLTAIGESQLFNVQRTGASVAVNALGSQWPDLTRISVYEFPGRDYPVIVSDSTMLYASDGTPDSMVALGPGRAKIAAFADVMYIEAGNKLVATDGTITNTRILTSNAWTLRTNIDAPTASNSYALVHRNPELWSLKLPAEIWTKLPIPAEQLNGRLIETVTRLAQPFTVLVLYSFNPQLPGSVWATNGTAEGTVQLPLAPDGRVIQQTADKLVWIQDVAAGTELWELDLHTLALNKLANVPAHDLTNNPYLHTNFFWTEHGLFLIEASAGRSRFWWVDLIQHTATNVTDLPPSTVLGTVSATDRLLVEFSANNVRNLAVIASTASASALLPSMHGSVSVIASNDHAIFFNYGTTYRHLWVSDGTLNGTRELSATEAKALIGTLPDGTLLFAGHDSRGTELWRTDGTVAGTRLVGDLNPGLLSTDFAANSGVVRDGKLEFLADDGRNGRELWQTDGTALGTTRLTDLNPGPPGGVVQRWNWAALGVTQTLVLESAVSANYVTLVTTLPDLRLNLAAPQQVVGGPTAQLTLELANRTATAHAVQTATLTLPAGVSYVSDTAGAAPTIAGNTVTWMLPAPAPGAASSWAVTVSLPAAAPGTLEFSSQLAGYAPSTLALRLEVSRALLPLVQR